VYGTGVFVSTAELRVMGRGGGKIHLYIYISTHHVPYIEKTAGTAVD